MELKEIVRIINDIESSFNVDKWNIEGMDMWPYIRFKLGSKLYGSKNSPETLRERLVMKYVKGISKYILHWLKNFKSYFNLEKTDVLFIENGLQSANLNGRYYYIRTDALRDQLEKEGFKCKTLIRGYNFNNPLYNEGLFIQYDLDLIALKYMLQNRFKGREVKRAFLAGYDEFIEYLKDRDIYFKGLEKDELFKAVGLMLKYKRYYINLFRKLNPKVVSILCYYSTNAFPLIAASKELGVAVMDLQHGIQGEQHYAYARYANIPKRGYNLLPDIFYVWGQKEADNIRSWSNGSIQVFIGGNKFIDMWRDGNSKIVSTSIRSIKEKYELNKYEKIILFTVRSEYEHDNSTIEAIKKSPKNWFWFVRLHPKRLDMKDYVEERIGTVQCGYVIEGITELPLYALLRISDVHITGRSGTVIEAAELGVKSVITDFTSIELYQEEFEKKMAVHAKNSKEIIELILNSKKEKVDSSKETEKISVLINIINKFNES